MSSVNHAGITVSDLKASIAFYETVLGGTLVGPWERSGPRIDQVTGYTGVIVRQAFITAPDGGAMVELLQYENGSDVTIDPDNGSIGAVHVAIEVDDFDGMLERLAAQGVPAVSAPITASAGPLEGRRVVYVMDPDRVRVELVESLPA